MSSLFFDCPHCKMILKKNATFCPICGSDKRTGWSENAQFELPTIEESYHPRVFREIFMKIVAAILVVAILAVYL